ASAPGAKPGTRRPETRPTWVNSATKAAPRRIRGKRDPYLGRMSESSEASAYFRRVGPNTFVPTVHTTGAWTADEQHFSPVAGLLAHEIQRLRTAEQRPAMAISRVTFDILGRVPVGEFEVEARVVRPGRTIELVEATAFAGGRAAVTARVWLMVTG